MAAAADAPHALPLLLARVLRAALLAANAQPGGPWGDEGEPWDDAVHIDEQRSL
jgi:hypothetical protein